MKNIKIIVAVVIIIIAWAILYPKITKSFSIGLKVEEKKQLIVTNELYVEHEKLTNEQNKLEWEINYMKNSLELLEKKLSKTKENRRDIESRLTWEKPVVEIPPVLESEIMNDDGFLNDLNKKSDAQLEKEFEKELPWIWADIIRETLQEALDAENNIKL